jgi:hypothetical protein
MEEDNFVVYYLSTGMGTGGGHRVVPNQILNRSPE